MHYVYILYSENHDLFYIGETATPAQRLAQHNSGKVISTKKYMPWTMVWLGEKANRTEALRLEKKLKNLHSPIRIIAFIKKYGSWNY